MGVESCANADCTIENTINNANNTWNLFERLIIPPELCTESFSKCRNFSGHTDMRTNIWTPGEILGQ